MPNGEEKAKSEGATTFNMAHASPLRSRTTSMKALTSVGNCRKLATVKVLSADANGGGYMRGCLCLKCRHTPQHQHAHHAESGPAQRYIQFMKCLRYIVHTILF